MGDAVGDLKSEGNIVEGDLNAYGAGQQNAQHAVISPEQEAAYGQKPRRQQQVQFHDHPVLGAHHVLVQLVIVKLGVPQDDTVHQAKVENAQILGVQQIVLPKGVVALRNELRHDQVQHEPHQHRDGLRQHGEHHIFRNFLPGKFFHMHQSSWDGSVP